MKNTPLATENTQQYNDTQGAGARGNSEKFPLGFNVT